MKSDDLICDPMRSDEIENYELEWNQIESDETKLHQI